MRLQVHHNLPECLLYRDCPISRAIRAVESAIRSGDARIEGIEEQRALADWLALAYRQFATSEAPELIGFIEPPEIILRRHDGVIVHRSTCSGLA